MLTTDELDDVVSALRSVRTDTSDVEAKRAHQDVPRDLKETLSSFSNTRGGIIILGLDEASGFAATGVADAAQTASTMSSWCASEMDPPVRASVDIHDFEGVHLVVVDVPAMAVDQLPCRLRSNGYAFRRTGDGDHRLSHYEIQMLMSRRAQPRDDERPALGASIDDLDPSAVEAYVERLRSNHPAIYGADLDVQSTLTQAFVLVTDAHGQRVPSLAGLLALGRFPQRLYPQLNLTFVHYATVEGEELATGERFLDNQKFEGPIPVIAKDALDAIRRNMKRRSILRGDGRHDVWEYPERALREVVANALVHRDLSDASHGAQVQIEMFPDRLVIRNPGGLYGPVTEGQLGEGVASSARNARLMRLLEDVPIPGQVGVVCENRGSGIRVMVQALRDAGMSAPVFRDRISTFEVTFPNHTLLNDETVGWIHSLELGEISDSQSFALAMMYDGSSLTNTSYREATRVDSRKATAELRDLVEKGVVESSGQNRWATYRLASRAGGRGGRTRPTPTDRRDEILRALGRTHKSRAELEVVTGLSGQAVRSWLKILQDEGRVRLDGKPQSNKARYLALPPYVEDPIIQLEFNLGESSESVD
jgi:ATP-dependent DNA helicase RecG